MKSDLFLMQIYSIDVWFQSISYKVNRKINNCIMNSFIEKVNAEKETKK